MPGLYIIAAARDWWLGPNYGCICGAFCPSTQITQLLMIVKGLMMVAWRMEQTRYLWLPCSTIQIPSDVYGIGAGHSSWALTNQL